MPAAVEPSSRSTSTSMPTFSPTKGSTALTHGMDSLASHLALHTMASELRRWLADLPVLGPVGLNVQVQDQVLPHKGIYSPHPGHGQPGQPLGAAHAGCRLSLVYVLKVVLETLLRTAWLMSCNAATLHAEPSC